MTLPTEIQKYLKIKKEDEILLVKDKKTPLKNQKTLKMDNEFDDSQDFSKKSLKIWLNKNDNICDRT